MRFRVNEWPQRMFSALAQWMGEMGQAQAHTNLALESIGTQVQDMAKLMSDPLHAQTQALVAENRLYRTRLWNTGARATQLEQTLAATEERLYFATAERDRLETELRQGRLREGTLSEHLLALRADKASSQAQVARIQRTLHVTQVTVKRASDELLRLHGETAVLRQAVREAWAFMREAPPTSLDLENTRLEREPCLMDAETRIEHEPLREELLDAHDGIIELGHKYRRPQESGECADPEVVEAERGAAAALKEGWAEFEEQVRQVEEACIRLTSENTTLSIVLKEKEDALACADLRLSRAVAVQEGLQQELHRHETQGIADLESLLRAKDCIARLEAALAAAEQENADLNNQLVLRTQAVVEDRRRLMESMESVQVPPPAEPVSEPESRIMPWPKVHSRNQASENESRSGRSGETEVLDALAG